MIFLQEASVDDRAHVLELGRRDPGRRPDRARPTRGRDRSLRVTRGAPRQGYDDIAEGWITFAQQLRFALERGGRRASAARCTSRQPAPRAGAASRWPAELPGAPLVPAPEHQAGS